MIVSVNDDLWSALYHPILDHLHSSKTMMIDDDQLRRIEGWLAEMGIRVFNDGSTEGGWTHVELPDGEELIEMVLRWS